MPAADRRRRRAPFIIAGAALVVVIVAAVVGWAQLQRPTAPAQTATRFWQLLADGKAQDALALSSTPADSVPNGLLLGNAVYGKADRGIANVSAGTFVRHGNAASGTVAYTQHGAKHTATVDLALVHSGFLTRPAWQITNAPIARVDVTVASGNQADSLSVDGISLPLPGGDGVVAVPALPGTYSFALGASSGLFSPAPQKVSVTGATAAVTLGVTPSSKLSQQSVADATTLLNGCFTQPTLADGCSLADGIRNLFNLTAEQSVTYQLTRAPQLAFDAKAMQVKSTADGEITSLQSDAVNTPFHTVAQFSLTLDVAVKSGKITLTPYQGGLVNSDQVCIPEAHQFKC
ncbi:hypothetical protein [Gryllotalpicola protaetiae]|uniref:Uncharacterized protein n=1 Tax=Gryllotalpicola protaetiae TaxID=2419771 RepID=A0A387BNJ9_9MICO|nr:hypothetical protein [Gryllotalpicola protaetiae]AYG03594.1 hypothetical protein D7I44_08640 [Gryllotalpicola protaetiae]